MQSSSYQSYIDKNAHITFGDHVHVDTVEFFRAMKDSTLELEGNPLPSEKPVIEALFPCPIRWTPTKVDPLRPHNILAIVRDGLRKCFRQMTRRTENLKTLYIGAAYREVVANSKNKNAFFSFHDSECKDEDRIYTPMLERLSFLLHKAKASSSDLRHQVIDLPMEKEDIIALYAETAGLDDRIGINLERSGQQFTQLIYEDSHYNKGWEGIYEDFARTGALTAQIIGMSPMELVEEFCPENELYRITKRQGKTRMTDVRGFANGYEHDTRLWSDLMKAPAYQGKHFNLVSEIKAKVGPFCIFSISKTMKGGVVTRDVTLMDVPYVMICDLAIIKEKPKTAADWLLQILNDRTHFFLMKKEEWDAVYDYVASLDPKAVNITTIVAMIRKRSGGAALIDKVFTKKWDLQNQHYLTLAAIVVMKVARDKELFSEAMASMEEEGLWLRTVRSVLAKVKLPAWLVSAFWKENVVDSLVRPHDPVLEQTVELVEQKGNNLAHAGKMIYRLYSGKDLDAEVKMEEKVDCKVCKKFPWLSKHDHSDEQVMVCGNDEKEFEWKMTDAEVEAFRNKMLPDDTDPEGLARVKAQARECVPRHGFSVKTKYAVIEGAFGTGKSYQICKAMTKADAVLVPFKKLIDDYVLDANGDKIFVKTPHRAISDSKSVENIWIDECGSFPYEFAAVCAYLYQPQCVYLVGDMKQSKTLASEGVCLDRRLHFPGAHYLRKNFRNNSAVIEWAKEKYGYDMCASERTPAGALYEIVDEIPEGVEMISPDRALVNIDVTSNTVRAFQGQTVQDLGLVLTPDSLNTWAVPCIKLVGLTRAKGSTFVKLTNGCSADAFKALVEKQEYVAQNAQKRGRTTALDVGRFVLALRRRLGEARLEQFSKALHSEIMEALESEEKEESSRVEFEGRDGAFPSTSPETTGMNTESEEDEIIDEEDREDGQVDLLSDDEDEEEDEEEEDDEQEWDFCYLQDSVEVIEFEYSMCNESLEYFGYEGPWTYHGCDCECIEQWYEEPEFPHVECLLALPAPDGTDYAESEGPGEDSETEEEEEEEIEEEETEDSFLAALEEFEQIYQDACNETAELKCPEFAEVDEEEEKEELTARRPLKERLEIAAQVAAVAGVVTFGAGAAVAVAAPAAVEASKALMIAGTAAWATDVSLRVVSYKERMDALRSRFFKGEPTLAETIDAYTAAEADRIDAEFWSRDGEEQRAEVERELRMGRPLSARAKHWAATFQ